MKKIRWLSIGLVAILLAVMVGIYIRNMARGLIHIAQENTIDALKTELHDPDSMVIRSQFILQKNGETGPEIVECGIVDDKDGSGAVVSLRFFSKSAPSGMLGMVDTKIVRVESPDKAEEAKRLKKLSSFEILYWNENCIDAAHSFLESPK